jgi:phosphinothricin acetyltransferase
MSARLRPAHAGDAAAVAAIYAPIVRDTPISFEVDPPDAGEMGRRIGRIGPVTPWLVCELPLGVAGYAYATSHRERAAYRFSVDVTVYVHEACRGRGVGAALYAALLPILELQGFHRAYAGITLPNPASVRLHESVGFTALAVYREVGWKCGAWRDVGWWERALAECADPPREPLRFDAIAGAGEVTRALAAGAARVREVA